MISYILVHPMDRRGVLMAGLALLWMALAPSPAQGQSAVCQPPGATTGNIYYNGGNVGIGTSSPSEALHLSGNGATRLIIRDNSGGAYARMVASGTTAYYGGSYNTDTMLQAGGVNYLIVKAGTGRVGIGTSNPATTLHVAAPDNPTPMLVGDPNCGGPSAGFMGLNFGQTLTCSAFTLLGNGGHTWLAAPYNIYFRTNLLNRMVVDFWGNVGIGTTAPRSPLHRARWTGLAGTP